MHVPRIPTSADFGDTATIHVSPTSIDQRISNVLILLHGLGDTEQPFSVLGSRLNIPETLCLSVRGPHPLPFDSHGFHWGNDIIFDQASGGLDMDSGFDDTRQLFKTIIDEVLVNICGWSRRKLFFFGFGQGGMVALDIAASLPAGGPDSQYGGVVSIGGPPSSTTNPLTQKPRTPILVIGSAQNSAITDGVEARLKNIFESVEICKWRGRNGDGMMKNAEETMPIMRFFASRLYSYAGIPEGSVEIS
ncbi:phospholipase/Carboxylesterase-like protein [Geopyxis carbonaria]|nr:phospholipase/Carboxylesterase-like protein [Geopyxis carbonaria]